MATLDFNLDQTREFEKNISNFKQKLINNVNYRENVLQNGNSYLEIKEYFTEHLLFLQYTRNINIDAVYRVRRLANETPFMKKSELLYPPPSIKHQDRMNNMSSRVLYVSLHEYTAMAETRIDASFINSHFQLTRFSADREFTVFSLGDFNDIYKNTPRDSIYFNRAAEHYISHSPETTVKGYAALECAIAEVLYDQTDNYHMLSSIMADAIFTANPKVEAIMYPSAQNRYGTNFAINKKLSDELIIKNSFVNKLIDVYRNGFFKYSTVKECIEINDNNLVFSTVENASVLR